MEENEKEETPFDLAKKKIIANGGKLEGSAAYFLEHQKKHPTYDTIYAEHNEYWAKRHEEYKSMPDVVKDEKKEEIGPKRRSILDSMTD